MAHADTPNADAFASTHWSLVGRAADDGPSAHAALLTLCLRYWYPVHAYLRRSGHAPLHAQELTRAFFQELLQDQRARADMGRQGPFRHFLLSELHRFLASDAPRKLPDAPLEGPALDTLEARLRGDGSNALSPEQQLHRGFAVDLLAAARQRLQREARDAGRSAMFHALHPFLGRDPEAGEYEATARQLGVPPMVVSIAVRRLRQRFRELVDQELSRTLPSGEDAQRERAALLQALGDGGG